ncbi:porin [Vibrio sp. HN007]|uniref:porin n=1 Tax=Vibrio iocasae TaxID=3098914 RepID=UPI0035D52312
MKLKPIALAIPMVLAAGSLSAAEVYNKDGNSVELSGWAKAFGNVLDTNAVDKEGKELDKDLHVLTDANLTIKATHTIDEESKLIGTYAINTGSSIDKNASFDDIKFEYDHTTIGNISIGDTGNSFGAIEKAGAGEGDNLYAIGQGGVDGQGLRYKNSFGDFNFSANYETDSSSDVDSNYAFSGEYKVEDSFSVAVAYGSDGDEASSSGIGADVNFGDLKFGVTYISFEGAGSLKVNDDVELELDPDNKGDSYALKAEYVIGAATVYGSFQQVDGESKGVDVEASTMYAGVDYKFTDSITSYVVIQDGTVERAGVEKEGTNFKFGAKYSF